MTGSQSPTIELTTSRVTGTGAACAVSAASWGTKPEPQKVPLLLHVTKMRRKLVACNGEANMAHVNSRVQKHRDALRMAGLRPVQIWV
ncbi:antitoxin MazE-like protein, partial [Xanthomonas hortorum]|uniref:antitoxin MazE-like protein n=1 Tax=Xanthomonas hortorum TaxID=56454 RepID=UPI001F4D3551